jgi:hypothetical protein
LILQVAHGIFLAVQTLTNRWLLILLITLAAALPASAETSAGKLLNEIIRDPGHWSQMCVASPPIPFDVPFPFYSLATPRYFSLSQENVARLQKARAQVVPEIVRRMGKIDLSRPAKQKKDSFSTTDSDQDPNHLTGLLLDIILELNAVETLPELLRLEADLNFRLKTAEKDGGASLPVLDAAGPVRMTGVDSASKSFSQRERTFVSRIFQRELLSVMAALLRQERFQPLLDSELERSYLVYLKKEAQSEMLKGIKKPEDVSPKEKGWVTFDPIHGLPVIKHWLQFTKYTPELRLKIREWVNDFLKPLPGARRPGDPTTPK